MVWKVSIHSGLSYRDVAPDGALDECQWVAEALCDHGQQPHHQQGVEGCVPGAVHERGNTQRGQGPHHRREFRDRGRGLQARLIEQRLVVIHACGLDAPAQGEWECPGGGLIDAAEMEPGGHARQHLRHPRLSAKVAE